MKQISINKTAKLSLSEENMQRLSDFLTREVEDAFSSRSSLESVWRELLRQYEGVPKNPVKNFPIENAPNIEVTLGAIAADSIYAQVVDLLDQSDPFITCRAMGSAADTELVNDVKALQKFANYMSTNELGFETSGDDFTLDNVQLGTSFFYVPWTEIRRKTRVSTTLSSGPRAYCMPIEDVIVPGGSKGALDDLPWIGFRFYHTMENIKALAKANDWNTLGIQAAGAKDWVRTRRENLGQHIEGLERKGHLYEILDIYCYFDIDGDGIDEDLYVVFDRTSRSVLKVGYAPYDRRPGVLRCYQRRPHMVYGIGVLQMLRSYEEELTDLHNYQTLNVLLANSRMWVAKEGAVDDDMRIWPNKKVSVPNPKEDLIPLQMGEIYASLPQLQAMIIQLAERRVGVNEMSNPRASSVMGNRTPGITTLSLLQQVNKRFAPAFNSIRDGFAGAVIQGLYRYQERLLANDAAVMAHITQVVGVDEAQSIFRLLRDKNFDERVNVELTVTSSSVNKEADRQNAMMLVNILSQYYQRTLELVTIAANPQTPPAVVDVAKKIANSAGEIIDRTIRTFDQIRDPIAFIINVDEEIDAAAAGAPQQAITQLLGMMPGATGGGQPPTSPPPIGAS